MIDDYRNTKYCPNLAAVIEKKNKVVEMVKKDHPNAVDMHNYIKDNDKAYKNEFMMAYNYKCAYCGVSIDLLDKRSYEIDHFIYEKAPCFKSKKEAGYIENLILSCHNCNHNKSSFLISDESFESLHPDKDGIIKTFVRDELYYIKISGDYEGNLEINKFYKQLKLGSELHRLDYLLMSMIGFQQKHCHDDNLYRIMGQLIHDLRKKRNMI